MSEYEKVQLLPGVSAKRKKREQDKDRLIPHRKDGLVWLTAPQLDAQDWLIHGFSTRLGGVSGGEIGSMNLSFTRGDREENVRENYRRLGEAVGFDPRRLVL
ncbi:MAG: laccase domain-containing protein, partial [Lachnospiraceae bacterium]|nr:laccase domain-containing protein [Lachnospiraceae bacterium]